MKIAVLGAGSFGTSLAMVLEGKGHDVTLWVRTDEGARRISETRESPHLAGYRLGPGVTVTHDLAAAVAHKPVVVGVTPSHAIREVFGQAAPHLHPDVICVNASKGIEEGTLETIDAIYGEVLPAPVAGRAVYLSGPTFAAELARGLPSAIVGASRDAAAAQVVQKEFSTLRFRVYTSDDVTGVLLGGALKNICAIGAGIADGLGFGHNARAALITRGIAEITRVGVAMGANPLTFAGLAGVGDLVLTCTGDLSRNRRVGLELGRGKTLDEILASMNSVAEGVKTTRAAYDLSRARKVEMPITQVIYEVLYEQKSPRDAVTDLMGRELKPERG